MKNKMNRTKKENKNKKQSESGMQKNLTGTWRTFKPVINLEKCTGCRTCYDVCPDSCIKMAMINNKIKATINYNYCKGCLLCKKECPFKAIDSIEEKENES